MANNSVYNPLPDIVISRTSASASWVTVPPASTRSAPWVGEPPDSTITSYVPYVIYDTASNPDDHSCDTTASPLVVDVKSDHVSDPDGILSAPQDGVQFDILGANAAPAYSTTQISWIRNPQQFMFLVLPKNGQVNSIDEMFGNNTLGPDGKFAANGFVALAKYDADGIGYIDRRYPVFSQLRLWSDANGDGIAQPSELFTLQQMGITRIDVIYRRRFNETDQYGNKFKYKSAVIQNGVKRATFDIWFVLGK